ncbi:Protein TIC 20-II, chloroplastic [Sarracenia purpurea var. burkii]
MASISMLRYSLPPHAPSSSPNGTTPRFRLLPQLRSTVKTPLPRPVAAAAAAGRTPPSPSFTPSISMSYNLTPATDRLISTAAYFLPLFNGLQYGRFLLAQYPVLGAALEPILPLLALYRSVPYASFVAFFALYLGVVRNPRLSRYVRFNAMQAVVLDVLLVLPLLLQRIFNPGRAGMGYKLMVMGHNAVFVFVVFCFVYSLVFCVLGRTPYLPFVAEAAGRQL